MHRGDLLYDVVVLLHLLGAIVGIGGTFLNGLYGAEAKKRPGWPGLAVAAANERVSQVAEYVIFTIPVTGAALVVMNDYWSFGQTWVWSALILYFLAIGVARGNQIPCARRMQALGSELAELSEQRPALTTAVVGTAHGTVATTPPSPPVAAGGPPPQVAEMHALGRRLSLGGATLNLLTVAIIVLMVWKPGY
jgi:uncharacterized membrane protein